MIETDAVPRLVRAAHAARITASAVRWLSGCLVAFAGLLAVSVALAMFERNAPAPAPEPSASAYLDFDLSVLRALGDESLAADAPRLRAMWARRPDWRLPAAEASAVRLVSPREAWAAVTSGKSRFRTAARGAADALPFLLGGLALAFAAAAAGGLVAQVRQMSAAGRVAFAAAVYLLVVHPLWLLLDPSVFYDRTRSLGLGFSAAVFVAAFAGVLPGAASRAAFAPSAQGRHLRALGSRRALLTAARLAALDAADWLLPLVPAVAAAALFVCAKADQDPALHADSNGLGALIRAALREASVGERLSSCALAGAGLILLWYVGHRFVVEVRRSLGVAR